MNIGHVANEMADYRIWKWFDSKKNETGKMMRKKVFKKIYRPILRLVFFFLILLPFARPANGQIGNWSFTRDELPMYQYTATLPFEMKDKERQDSRLPEDPYFLIGNYRLGLFTHVSGIFQFMTAERTWSRINFEEKQPNYGSNLISVTLKNNGKRRLELAYEESMPVNYVSMDYKGYCSHPHT